MIGFVITGTLLTFFMVPAVALAHLSLLMLYFTVKDKLPIPILAFAWFLFLAGLFSSVLVQVAIVGIVFDPGIRQEIRDMMVVPMLSMIASNAVMIPATVKCFKEQGGQTA